MSNTYTPSDSRYNDTPYVRCGYSSLRLPRISLGLWQNFGTYDDFEVATQMITHSFDRGITHFDLANNYGPVPGSAEENFGRIFRSQLSAHRDELIISSKAGHEMWAGPYGGNSSRKSILASADQSLRRTGLEYFDIFYTHRYDGETPISETVSALVSLVRSGKALYVGVSKYPPKEAALIYDMLREEGVPCLVSQYRYSMFERTVEAESLALAAKNGSGVIAFSSLAQGLLTNKYIGGIPSDSRVGRSYQSSINSSFVTPEKLAKITALNTIAESRGQTLAQMALGWVLRREEITSVVIGASRVAQIDDSLKTLQHLSFSNSELEEIEEILK
ncbi:MAG: aldo/keto reductase [Rikenellaceae bacterium]